jgi:hypothetical protein
LWRISGLPPGLLPGETETPINETVTVTLDRK